MGFEKTLSEDYDLTLSTLDDLARLAYVRRIFQVDLQLLDRALERTVELRLHGLEHPQNVVRQKRFQLGLKNVFSHTES